MREACGGITPGAPSALILSMRIVIGLVIVAAAIGAIAKYRHHEEAPAATLSVAQPTSSRTPYAHDWAKSALDRAGEVKKQVLEQRQQNDNK